MTIRYRTAHLRSPCALPQLDRSWWQAARRLPIPWQPRLELEAHEGRVLAWSRRGL